MNFNLTELFILVLCIFGSVFCFSASFFGFISSVNTKKANIPFTILAFSAGWYTLWTCLYNFGIYEVNIRFLSLSPLFSGYSGPAYFFFTYAMTNDYDEFDPRYYLLLLFGLMGTIPSMAILTDPDLAIHILDL